VSELADARRADLEAQKVSRTGDAGIADQITTNLQLGRTFAHVSELVKRIASLTPDDVKDALRNFINPMKPIMIRAGDFKR
jgi:zinc protease